MTRLKRPFYVLLLSLAAAGAIAGTPATSAPEADAASVPGRSDDTTARLVPLEEFLDEGIESWNEIWN
jgi:hypothetical protein